MIAIKDIKEMPSCCYECPYFDDYCALTGKWESDTEQIRDNDCPLVEIVTCKDCIKGQRERSNSKKYYMWTGRITEDDFYCKDGKRREK